MIDYFSCKLICSMPEVLPLSPDQEPDLSTFENKSGLAEDMKFLASMPELCDVTFLVGDTRGKFNIFHLLEHFRKKYRKCLSICLSAWNIIEISNWHQISTK